LFVHMCCYYVCIFLVILIRVFVTSGHLSELLAQPSCVGEEAIDDISIIIWVPILISVITIVISWKTIPKTLKGWFHLLDGSTKSVSVIGVILLLSFSSFEIV